LNDRQQKSVARMFKQDIDLYVEYDRSAFENNCCSSEI